MIITAIIPCSKAARLEMRRVKAMNRQRVRRMQLKLKRLRAAQNKG